MGVYASAYDTVYRNVKVVLPAASRTAFSARTLSRLVCAHDAPTGLRLIL